MVSPEIRAHESGDRTVRVMTLDNGDFLVNVISGAVAMAVTIPASQIDFLFPRPTKPASAAA